MKPAKLLALALFACASCKEKAKPRVSVPPSQRPVIAFYSIENCFLCEDLRRRLTGLKRFNTSLIIFQEYSQHLKVSQEAIARYGFTHHGISVTDSKGRLLWKADLHQESDAELESIVEKLAKGEALPPLENR